MTKSLSDVPCLSTDSLERLAALAPKDPAEDSAGKKTKKTKSKASGKSTLGALKLPEYLDHYGQRYKVKQRGGRTLYQMDCLFNPDHHSPDAYIQQGSDGKIIYVCSHNSCSHYKWNDARKKISGQDSLAPYCEGYDSDWKPKQSSAPPHPPLDQDQKGETPNVTYLAFNPESGKPIFNPARMANFLEQKFKPLLHEGKSFGNFFYHYKKDTGVWKWLPPEALRQCARIDLGDYAKPYWILQTLQLLEDQAYKSQETMKGDQMWINIRNGMLNIDTMEIRPHSPEFYSRVQIPVEHDPKASSLFWEDRLVEIFIDDPEKVTVLKQFAGYCLYPRILFPCAVFGIGQGKNGKGMIEKVLCAMLGKENVSHISLSRMNERFGPIGLKDKLLNSCGETEAGQLDVTNFKALAAGDEVQVEVKNKDDVKFVPIAKHLISMNAFPGIKEKTDAFFRRIIVLEYKQRFEGEEDDKRLADTIINKHLNGVFRWALEGLKEVLEKEEVYQPECVENAKQRFKVKVNPSLLFVEEECTIDETCMILPKKLYNEYVTWCEVSKQKPLGRTNFYENIQINFSVKKGRHETKEYFEGIGLNSEPCPLVV